MRAPRARPFPLAVFAHGNHNPLENSTPGYLYLCQLLASHGIIAATIDVNFLNGFNFGENDGRAIVHLEHLKQFRTWNNTATHPLHGKVDLNRILIVGHSRGGEAVGHASFFNRLAAIGAVILDGSAGLGPYRFGLSAVAAIAPTDRQFTPVSGPTVVPDSYYLIHGSKDSDVFTFEGYHTYERAHAVDLANPTVSDGKFKAMLWGAQGEPQSVQQHLGIGDTPWRRDAARQPGEIAKVHLGALAQAVLLDRAEYLDVLRDHGAAVAWDPAGTEFVSHTRIPSGSFVQHNQEGLAPPVVSLPVQGTVAADGVVAARQLTALVGGAPTTTITLRLVWSALGSPAVESWIPRRSPRNGTRRWLRVGQSTEANNAANRDQDFTLEVSSGSRTAAIPASSLHRLLYPDPPPFGPAKIVMQTLRLPVERLVERGVDPTIFAPSLLYSTDERPARSTSAICNVPTDPFEVSSCSHRNHRKCTVEVVAAQPTEADSAAIAHLSAESNRSLPQVVYVVKVQLKTKPPATSMAWALYVDDVLIPKYWEYAEGIYFTVMDPQFFADHKGERLRFSQDGVDFHDTGIKLPTNAPAAASDPKVRRPSKTAVPLQADVLK